MSLAAGSGRQSTAIQRAKMDQMNREIRAKQVRKSFADPEGGLGGPYPQEKSQKYRVF